jgi:hypothetical protein
LQAEQELRLDMNYDIAALDEVAESLLDCAEKVEVMDNRK